MTADHEHKKEEHTHNHEEHAHHSHISSEHHEHASNAKTSHEVKSDEENPEDRSKNSMTIVLIIVGAIIIIIAAIIIISKHYSTNSNQVEYNHYLFEKFEGNKWMTQQLIRGQLYNIPFYYNPKEVEDIPIDPNSINLIRSFGNRTNTTLIYISVDPSESSKIVLAGVEYARILGTAYNIYNMNVKSAIQRPYNSTAGIPIITCKNQSSNVIVIYPTVTDKNLVSVHGNCIVIESKNVNESVRVADAFSFRLLNIMTDNTASSTSATGTG